MEQKRKYSSAQLGPELGNRKFMKIKIVLSLRSYAQYVLISSTMMSFYTFPGIGTSLLSFHSNFCTKVWAVLACRDKHLLLLANIGILELLLFIIPEYSFHKLFVYLCLERLESKQAGTCISCNDMFGKHDRKRNKAWTV